MSSKPIFAAMLLSAIALAPVASANSENPQIKNQLQRELLAGYEEQFKLTEPGRAYIACVREAGVDASNERCDAEIVNLLSFNAKRSGIQQYEILPLEYGARNLLRRTASRYLRHAS